MPDIVLTWGYVPTGVRIWGKIVGGVFWRGNFMAKYQPEGMEWFNEMTEGYKYEYADRFFK